MTPNRHSQEEDFVDDILRAQEKLGGLTTNERLLLVSFAGLCRRLKLISDRLAEFEKWTDETAAPDCDRREDDLCDWHNRLLSAVHQARAIATEVGDG